MKPLTTSVFTFSNLIGGGYLYIDKTAMIHRLVAEASGQYFLSRPRRFGKSLLVSTLKSIFLAQRELFKGLAIDTLPYDWRAYPVIHIDLGSKPASSPEELEANLLTAIEQAASDNSAQISKPLSYQAFEELVRQLSARGKVVILVDEYDKPLLGALGNPELARKLLPIMKSFYSVIKTTEPCQRFALLTGVSKFSKVSVFSDLNSLTDLTMDARAATLLGYTQEELELNFADRIADQAVRDGVTREALLAKTRDWYNGYRFAKNAPTVYNPVSVARMFDSGEFNNYWFETGTPRFLIELLRTGNYDLAALGEETVSPAAFSAYEVERLQVRPLLFQTGYLTIKDYNAEDDLYTLGYPNREVRNSFLESLADSYCYTPTGETPTHLVAIAKSLRANDLDKMFTHLRVFFASIPYDIQLANERYYQSVFHVLFTLLGVRIECEVRTERGRIDAVIKTVDRIFVFEFKLQGTAEEALAQIREKRYHEKYLADGRPLTLVGAAFDPATRNLERWLAAAP